MSNYIFSTLTNDNIYHVYDAQDKTHRLPIVLKSILIKGGAGVANKNLITPLGAVTSVTDQELEFLLTDEVFLCHIKNGFIKVEKRKSDIEAVVPDMKTRDKSAPIVPQDAIESDIAKPSEKPAKKYSKYK